MECRRIISAWCPFVLSVVGASTSSGEPQVEYFKNGDVGVFVATVPLAEGVDRATTIFSVESTDDSIYLLYVESPQHLHEQAAVQPRHELILRPEEQAKIDELNKQQQELANARSKPGKTYTNYGRLEGLKILLRDEETKGKDGDATLIAQTRNMIKDLEADIQKEKEEDERIGKRGMELYQEISGIQEISRGRLPEEAGQRPEDQVRVDELNTQRNELSRASQKLRLEIEGNRRTLAGLKGLLEEVEAKGDDARLSFIARTRDTIKNLNADIEQATAEQQRFGERWKELNEELSRIQTAARERLPQAAATLPVKVYGRFQGARNPTLTLLGRSSEELFSQPEPLGSIQLHLPSVDGGNDALLAGWACARARHFGSYVLESPFSSYYQFCLLQSVEKYGLPQRELPWTLQRGMRTDRNPDLYSIATGALAIQESLQLDAMTGRRTVPDDRSVPLGALDGPAIKSHPFEDMPQGRVPTTSPIAALVPYDAYYCSFASISKEIETSDLLQQWGTSLLRTLTVSARDSDLPSKYQEQLCIGVSLLTRLFGDLVIGEIVLTGSDPFLKEGTDLTIIIQVKDRMVFDKQMRAYIEEALTKNPDAKSATSTHEGVEILSVTAPDQRISSHSAYVGDYKVYSNSLVSLMRVIDTHARRRTSMGDNPDFRYMRTIFPNGSGEDGFLYFSDAFIRKLIGPRWKIEAQRRIICQNHLRMITNSATMYRTELRKDAGIETLVRERYLPEEALRCPDEGVYSIDPSGGAACSVHNRLRYCTPVDSVALTNVSKEEAEQYKGFVSNYNRYWSRYFDPIGIRFQVGNRVEVETCILPLIENSIYTQVRELAGGEPIKLASRVLTDRTIVAVTTKLNLSGPPYTDMLGEMQRALFPSVPPITEAVGSSLSINLCDSDVLFTVDDRAMSTFGNWMDLEDQLVFATILSSINLPAYAVLELKDPSLAETIIRELLKIAEVRQRAQGRRDPWADFDIDGYAAGTHNGHPIHTLAARLLVIKFRLHYAIASNCLIVSTKRYVLHDVLDALDKGDSAPAGEVAANVHVDIRPRAFDQLRTVAAVGWHERMRHACLKNLVPVRALIECHGASMDTIGSVSRHVEGVTPRCPAGGSYRYDAARDLVYCTLHGDDRHQRQNEAPTGAEPLLQFLKRLRDLSITLRFTEDGIMTKMALDLDPVQP